VHYPIEEVDKVSKQNANVVSLCQEVFELPIVEVRGVLGNFVGAVLDFKLARGPIDFGNEVEELDSFNAQKLVNVDLESANVLRVRQEVCLVLIVLVDEGMEVVEEASTNANVEVLVKVGASQLLKELKQLGAFHDL
jgi:hypothetical protein